jgi:hypothetical protein
VSRSKLTPEGRRGVEAYSVEELHGFLVEDAIKRHATFLPWAIAAYERIGEQRRVGAEAAYQAVLDEVESLTGLRRMPIASAATSAEMKRLGLL